MNIGTIVGTGALATSILLFSGCGGGGGNGGDEGIMASPTVKATTVITDENVDTVAAEAVGSIDSSNNGVNDSFMLFNAPIGEKPAVSAVDLIAHLLEAPTHNGGLKTRSLELRESGTEACEGGGSLSYNGTEEKGGTVIYNQCREDDMVINGKLIIEFIDDYHEKYQISNLTMKSPHMDIKYQFLVMNVTLDDYEDPVTIDATMTASIEFDWKEYDLHGKYEYNNYHLTMEHLDNPPVYTKIDGMVSTSCTGGWIKVATLETIQTPYYSCPSAGKIKITGANDDVVVRFDNGGVDITFEGNTTHYDSCTELKAHCNSDL